jgi:hypothetical protein
MRACFLHFRLLCLLRSGPSPRVLSPAPFQITPPSEPRGRSRFPWSLRRSRLREQGFARRPMGPALGPGGATQGRPLGPLAPPLALARPQGFRRTLNNPNFGVFFISYCFLPFCCFSAFYLVRVIAQSVRVLCR